MAWIKAQARLAYGEDRQAHLESKIKPSTALMHGINELRNAVIAEVHVNPGDHVVDGAKLITVQGEIRGKIMRESVAAIMKLGGQNDSRGCMISPEKLFVTTQVKFDVLARRNGVVIEVPVAVGDEISGGQPIAKINTLFKKTFKLNTLNAVVEHGGSIAAGLRKKLIHRHVNPPMFNVHVTIVKGQEHVAASHENWLKHDGKLIEFEYDDATVHTMHGFWFVKVRGDHLHELRAELGLTKVYHDFHLTIGRSEKKIN